MGTILTRLIAAPVVVICCGGKLLLIGSVFGGAAGLFSGLSGLKILLVAIVFGILLLIARDFLPSRKRDNHTNPFGKG
jgi:hypothetical protein